MFGTLSRTLYSGNGISFSITRTFLPSSSVVAAAQPRRKCSSLKLEEVGKLESIKLEGDYPTGQMFLHRLFGYRGVILFPWTAKVSDRDYPATSSVKGADSVRTKYLETQIRDAKDRNNSGKTCTYYQVLIDSRDCPHITHRAQTNSVTFLGSNSGNARNLYNIAGLDYVSHEDILPYVTKDREPIQHELFDKFLQHDGDSKFFAQEPLKAWQAKNHPWLELSKVHRETTENIRVTVIPFYLGCRKNQNINVYWWRYCVRLENLGEQTVQLRERNWRIYGVNGFLETVRGRGVVGQEPVLSADQPAFQYSCHISIQASSGHMWGTFRMEREDGHAFDCRIPPFSLDSSNQIDDNPMDDGGDDNPDPPTFPNDPGQGV